MVVAGLVLGLLLGNRQNLNELRIGINLPNFLPFGWPSRVDFAFALFALVLPKMSMTLGNAVIVEQGNGLGTITPDKSAKGVLALIFNPTISVSVPVIQGGQKVGDVSLLADISDLRAQLFELGVVSEERIAENGAWIMHVDVPRETAERLGRLPGKDGEIVREQLLA